MPLNRIHQFSLIAAYVTIQNFKKKRWCITRCTTPFALPAYDWAGGVPDGISPEGFSPEGLSPEGAVPFICMPSGGVPEGRVPFISIPAGGVPDADWFICISAGGVPEGATDESEDPVAACDEVAWGCSADAAALVTADDTEELPESEVQPATKIPAMRIADATNMIIMLLFMGYVSLLSGHASS